MRRRVLVTLICGTLLALSGPAFALCSSVPNSFVSGTLAQSGQVNANFAAVVACINGIDTSQIITGILPAARGGTGTTTSTGTGSVVLSNNPFGTNTVSTNGVERLPNGLILQWGAATITAASSVGVTFPIAFPNAGFSVTASTNNPAFPVAAVSFSQTGFTATLNGSASANVFWQALGN